MVSLAVRLRVWVLALIFYYCYVNQLRAGTIFNNFGPGDTYDTSGGYSLGLVVNRIGDAFSPAGSSFVVDTIELAAFAETPSQSGLDAFLMTDANGSPGTVIEAFHFTNPVPPTPLVADSVLRPILNADTQYWLIASLTNPEVEGTWFVNNIEDRGTHAFFFNGNWVVETGGRRGAFRITGTPVTIPEPSTFVLSLTGFASVVLLGVGKAHRSRADSMRSARLRRSAVT
jgi:hypothetical protein